MRVPYLVTAVLSDCVLANVGFGIGSSSFGSSPKSLKGLYFSPFVSSFSEDFYFELSLCSSSCSGTTYESILSVSSLKRTIFEERFVKEDGLI